MIDAGGKVLGRVATVAARLLQGKHKAIYTPFLDTGDHVVVINAARVKLTGRKEDQKLYRRHSGYEGGLREDRAKDVRQKHPLRMVEEAIRGMLPKTKLGDAMFRKLKVYRGRRASARRTEANPVRGCLTWQSFSTTEPAAARRRLRAFSSGPAQGAIKVNRPEFDEFFPTESLRVQVRQPLLLTETADKFDVLATVAGGGVSGQAGAIRLGIARALCDYNVELRRPAQEGRAPDPRRAGQGAQEVRHGGRAQALPVQQTLTVSYSHRVEEAWPGSR